MIKACVIGASGYTGAELVALLNKHTAFSVEKVFVSENSADAGKQIEDLHPGLKDQLSLTLCALQEENLHQLAAEMDAVFLATPHQASHDWMTTLSSGKAKVFDLSGAFRLKDRTVFAEYYGFEHLQAIALNKAVYGLADWYPEQIKQADIVAVPGCYPTAALTALKPLQNQGLIDPEHRPIINAVSGVSGAGRKAALSNSMCEVSLQAYGVLGHRHQPEIAAYLGSEVIFTPHLGNFKRGILATCTIKVKPGISSEDIDQAFQQAYSDCPVVRFQHNWPKVDDVANSPYCDLFWKFDVQSGYLVVSSAIDNLLKGAASQAIQCANLVFGFPGHQSLIPEARS